ncbi:MAG: rod shape-determining protein RodA [Ignavibacteriae bacterium]|nr:rod shape-determining protein RodA [Ignavibacteria bacterium]MBI3363366.1 rod shape-determining protein RodA [Ignavibacteriota bacterium]
MDSWFKKNIDYTTVTVVLLLLIIGIASVYSATYDAGASVYFNRQLIWGGIGFLLMFSIMFIPFRTLQLMSYPLYGISIMILLIVLAAGKVVAGSRSWFGVAGFGLQPSEIVKVTTILALASYLSNRTVNLGRLKHIAVAFGIVIVPVVLILLQPDMGTAIIYIVMLVVILYWAGVSNFLLITLIAPVAAAIATLSGTTAFVIVLACTVLMLVLLRENRLFSALVFSGTVFMGASVQYIFGKLAPHQQKRILTFLNPDADPLGAGYNVIQSKIAIGSGGLFGKGYLLGTQTQLNFLPAQWTDFIYCVPSEEFGFVGAFAILSLLTILLIRGVQTASTVKSRYASIVAIGVVAAIAVHTVINIGMAMGIMPVIGVPLPFMSYGGSNLLTNMVMAGLLLNVYANRKEY